MTAFDAPAHPHRRLNPLTGRSVIVSAQRSQRPWSGQQESTAVRDSTAHDPGCYLCAGNARAGGVVNPDYDGVFVFTNDFAALTPDSPEPAAPLHALLQSTPARGTCRVLCFSPHHSRSLPEMNLADIVAVVQAWMAQTAELGAHHRHVQVFENKGAMMGCSSPHPHAQIWATDHLPDEVALEDQHQRQWHARSGNALLLDYAQLEAADGARTVVETEHWLAVVPFWAAWPFETLLLPKAPVSRLTALSHSQAQDLAHAIKRLTTRYDNLFRCSFPYSMGWHGAPFDGVDPAPWQLHAHYFPPLQRSATVRKFMAGFELLGETQRDLSPEQAAQALRAVSDEVLA
jgi:UDPglucose--hexose-1-phosphate uridylyltransferase